MDYFRIAGDGPLRPELLREMRPTSYIIMRFKFLGENHDIATFLSGAKFLAHTSETEGCPNVVMEAMACGIPVVAMDAGDIPYLVEEGKTGFVVPQGDEKTFTERLLLLLGNKELCVRMGLSARAKAEQELGVVRLVSETLAAYRATGWKDEATRI